MNKHWISLCKVNRPDKNRDIWMLRLADAVGGVLVAPYFDKQKEQIHDNRLFVFCDDGPTEPGRIGFWEWEEFESEPGRWKTTSTYMEQASPVEVISKALLRQLSRVISDAKVMVDSPERAKDMEMLFGVMPICVLTGRLDVMREVLEAESGISSAVKAEAERYLKDE